jgi:replication-associated recombination protein RarA
MAAPLSLFAQPNHNATRSFGGLTERYRPATIDGFIGLATPKRIMAKLVASPVASAWVLEGPSGTGKTTMALALCDALDAELIQVKSAECTKETIERVRRMCDYLPMAGGWRIILVDEADTMSETAQNLLLSMLDATDMLPQTIWIFTANGTDGLRPRFLSRCKRLDFSPFGTAPAAATLLESIWDAEASCESARPNFARIVKDAKCNIREAMQALELELMLA